jgi:hypothetical protein
MTLFDRRACQAIRLGARALAAGRVEMAVSGLDHIPTDGPVPFSYPPLSSFFRRCCAVSFNPTSDPYPGDLGLGEKQLRQTFSDTGHYNGTLASRSTQQRSTSLCQPGPRMAGEDLHSRRHQTLST